MNRTGKSPGLTLRKHGGVVISIGSRRCATVSAVCTSSAAPSMLRLRSNWMVMRVVPSDEVDVIEVMPEMVDNCRSIGAATEAAMVSALAPGSVAVISMVGKSTARQRRDRQQPVGEDAEHDERRRDERRQHRPADAELGKVHVRTSALQIRPWRRGWKLWCRSTAAAGRR